MRVAAGQRARRRDRGNGRAQGPGPTAPRPGWCARLDQGQRQPQRRQAVAAADRHRRLAAHGGHKGLQFRLQRLLAADGEAHHLPLADPAQDVERAPQLARLGVLVKIEVLGQVVDQEHAPLAQDHDLAHLGRRQPVDFQRPGHGARKAQQRQQQILVIGVDAPLRFRKHADGVAAGQEAHDVDVVGGQVDDHAHVAYARREGARCGGRRSGRCAPGRRRRASLSAAGWPG